jgi:uncharacterized protein
MQIPASVHAIISQQPYPLLFATLSGSHLYGFPSPDSDYDLRGVHILPLEQIVGLETQSETIELMKVDNSLEIDLVTYDVKTFFLMLLKKNGNVLEQIYSPLVLKATPEFEELKSIAKKCITRHHSHHYIGFSTTQWKLFEKEQKRSVKSLLYVYRGLLTGIYLMQTGIVEANLVNLNQAFNLSYIPDLIAAKLLGAEKSILPEADISFYQNEYDRLRFQLEEAHQSSSLPETPTAKAELHNFLLRLRLTDKN